MKSQTKEDMPPTQGLVHLKEYKVEDSNVELIGTSIDHQVKYNSALTEPAWNDGQVGQSPGLRIWRIEQFEVVPWPADRAGEFHTGDSYIVLNSYTVRDEHGGDSDKLAHDIFFWLGSHTSQDEAGTAAYKTVELDEFLRGAAVQHREVEEAMSDAFVALFPRIRILSGGVRSGFRHVEEEERKEVCTLLRVFKYPPTARKGVTLVYEVEPMWKSLDEGDVFVLDRGEKIWVWQGKRASPMEKAKAAEVVHDMTLEKHIEVEVLAQSEARSRIVVSMLGGGDEADGVELQCPRPVIAAPAEDTKRRKLFRISDAEGQLAFETVKEGENISKGDFDGSDVFLLDTGRAIWVWEGLAASAVEKAMWMKIAQAYIRQLAESAGNSQACFLPLSKVKEGNENKAFWRAVEA